MENLVREGVPLSRIKLVGNIMIDSLLANLEKVEKSTILSRLKLEKRRFIYVTLHRPSNVDTKESLTSIMRAFAGYFQQDAGDFSDAPTHTCASEGIWNQHCSDSNITILDPVGYHDSLALTQNPRVAW